MYLCIYIYICAEILQVSFWKLPLKKKDCFFSIETIPDVFEVCVYRVFLIQGYILNLYPKKQESSEARVPTKKTNTTGVIIILPTQTMYCKKEIPENYHPSASTLIPHPKWVPFNDPKNKATEAAPPGRKVVILEVKQLLPSVLPHTNSVHPKAERPWDCIPDTGAPREMG